MNIEKVLEMIMNFKVEHPKGDRMYNSNQIPSQHRNIQQDLPHREDIHKGLPPLDSAKHKRSVASIDQLAGESPTKEMKPIDRGRGSIDSGLNLFQKEGSTNLKNETPVFEA